MKTNIISTLLNKEKVCLVVPIEKGESLDDVVSNKMLETEEKKEEFESKSESSYDLKISTSEEFLESISKTSISLPSINDSIQNTV